MITGSSSFNHNLSIIIQIVGRIYTYIRFLADYELPQTRCTFIFLITDDQVVLSWRIPYVILYILWIFNRVTLRVSAVLATATWLAGCLDVTRRYFINSAKPILKLFRPPSSLIILLSSDPASIHNSKGNPFSGGVKIHGGMKNWRFSTEIAVYIGNGARSADGYYGTLTGNHRCRIEWYNFR